MRQFISPDGRKPGETSRNALESGAICTARAGRRRRDGEEGYILIAVLFLVVMVLIALSIAAPKMAASIQRDREVELKHRGLQYVRGIKMYYKKFGAYPPNMDALVKTNEIRFLRKRYKDPMTGKDDWHLIHFGEAKYPTAYGFFGQPIGGSTIAGVGPGGAGQNPGGSIFGNNGQQGNSSFGGSSSFGSNSFGSSGTGASSPGGLSGTDPNASSGAGATSGTGTSGTGTTGTGTSGSSPTDPNAAGGSSNSNPGGSIFGSGSSSGNGQTFGGGGIIGVESTNPKLTILEYKKRKHFNEWEFVYDPLSDQMMISNSTGVGQSMGAAGNGAATPGTFSGQGPTNSPIPQQNTGFPTTGGQPTSPTSPNPQ